MARSGFPELVVELIQSKVTSALHRAAQLHFKSVSPQLAQPQPLVLMAPTHGSFPVRRFWRKPVQERMLVRREPEVRQDHAYLRLARSAAALVARLALRQRPAQGVGVPEALAVPAKLVARQMVPALAHPAVAAALQVPRLLASRIVALLQEPQAVKRKTIRPVALQVSQAL